jgi:hypothetical protein
MFRDGRPILLSEIAELQFPAESDEQRALPPEKLAVEIVKRESRRLGFPPPDQLLRV